jgi:hypothetical protein
LWRRFKNTTMLSVIYALTGLALIPLALVLFYTVNKGIPAVSHPEFLLNVERPVGIPGSGISNAIVGTATMVGMASLVAIPVGIVSGVYLAEYGHARWATWVRLASDVLVGAPSIALGLFAYAVLVVPFHHYSAISASAALSILMLPVVIRTTESAVGLIPGGLRESGLAELLDDGREKCWSDGEIVKAVAERVVRLFRGENLIFEALIGGRIAEVALDVIDAVDEPLPEYVVDGMKSVFAHFLAELFAKGFGGHLIEGEADDREVLREQTFLREIKQRGEKLALGEVAAGAENYHQAGWRGMSRGCCGNAVSHRSGPSRKCPGE